jgi:pimeloyl-ACP methyl ester carboxylesterase
MITVIFISIAIFFVTTLFLPVFQRSEHSNITPTIREKAKGKFVRLSHGYTHYEIAGPENGSVIVLIHGFSVPYYMWDPTFTALSEAGFRVIRYDLYGRGLSDRPNVIYNRDLFVTQLAELIDSLALMGPINLIGNSMGGAIIAAFTAEYPELVGKLVLIDPFYEQWAIGLFKIPFIGEYLTASFLVPTSPRRQLLDFFHPERFPDWPKLFQEQMRYRGFGRTLLSTLRNFLSQDPTSDYRKIYQEGKSVLLIWGAEDRTLNPKGATKLYHILHPEFLWIEHAGHIPHYESPEIVNPRIIDFLAEHSSEDLIQKQA